MKIVGVIPARWGSTRFPGKSLAVLAGKPVVQWVFERASAARLLDQVVVATDDERIRSAVEQFGGSAVMTALNHPSGTDRVAEAVDGLGADIIINIQGDEPFIDPRLVDRLAEAMTMREGDWDMATAASPITDERDLKNPSVVKVVWAADGRALYFSRSPIPFDRDGGHGMQADLYWRHLGIYAYTGSFLKRLVATRPSLLEEVEKLEQLRALHIGGRIKVLQAAGIGTGIDTPEDLANAERTIRTQTAADGTGGRPKDGNRSTR